MSVAPTAPVRATDVRVWAADFAAGGLPPVCAITGEPTDKAYKRSFATAPAWIYLFILCGVLIGLIAFLIVAKRASGMLPLTAAAQKRAMRPTWIGLGLLIASIVLFFVGAGVSDSIGGAMILVASVSFIAGLIVLLVRRSFDIGAKVVDVHFPGYAMPVRAIDFKRAHPAFVAAVQQMYVARAVAPAPAPPPPFG